MKVVMNNHIGETSISILSECISIMLDMHQRLLAYKKKPLLDFTLRVAAFLKSVCLSFITMSMECVLDLCIESSLKYFLFTT